MNIFIFAFLPYHHHVAAEEASFMKRISLKWENYGIITTTKKYSFQHHHLEPLPYVNAIKNGKKVFISIIRIPPSCNPSIIHLMGFSTSNRSPINNAYTLHRQQHQNYANCCVWCLIIWLIITEKKEENSILLAFLELKSPRQRQRRLKSLMRLIRRIICNHHLITISFVCVYVLFNHKHDQQQQEQEVLQVN